MLPVTVRKRTIREADLVEIKTIVLDNWQRGRTHISRLLCERWNWRQPSGALRDMACRELLLTLERKGLIRLPPPLHNAYNDRRNRKIPPVAIDRTFMAGTLRDFPPPTLRPVRNSAMEPLYRSLVNEHHYLGYRQIVGAHLKYIAFLGDRPVACLGWGSAAWAVKSREKFIGWNKQTKDNNLRFVVNNTRFLILPWVSIKCLASKLLSLCAKTIVSDWIASYHHPVYLLETFVEKDRFRGTCYQAANWILVGETKGIAKRGHKHRNHGRIKQVYLYPLSRNFRKLLCR